MIKHGHTLNGKRTPEFQAWSNARRRCGNPNAPGYENYGGRGITMCERWSDFSNFLADMGHRPQGTSLDRIDNDGPYAPENCRWADRTTQSRNSRAAKLTLEKAEEIRRRVRHGETQYALAKEYGISTGTIHAVVHNVTWLKTPMGRNWQAKQE